METSLLSHTFSHGTNPTTSVTGSQVSQVKEIRRFAYHCFVKIILKKSFCLLVFFLSPSFCARLLQLSWVALLPGRGQESVNCGPETAAKVGGESQSGVVVGAARIVAVLGCHPMAERMVHVGDFPKEPGWSQE